MKLSTLQSPKDEKIDKKSEIIKIELQKYRMLKAKTASIKENDTPATNNDSLSDSKNQSMLNRNRISVAELLSPQTYQNLLMVKDDIFKRPKTPEKTLPTKKATPDKENYFTPTLSTLVAQVSNSKLRTQEAKSPENRFTHDFNPKSCQSSIMRDYDDRQSLGSHEERFASRQERKSTTPLNPKSMNRPSSSHSNLKQRQSTKTPEKIMPKYQSNKKPLSDSKSLNSNPQTNDFEEVRSPSVKKAPLNKSRDGENTYEALADLKRQLSKKKLSSDYDHHEEDSSKIKKQNPYKRSGTPDNHSRRESIDMNNSKLGTSTSKSNLHSTVAKETGNDKALLDEIEKWKKFGKMMADSYEELNSKFQNFMKESDKDKKVIEALKEQVTKLKSLIKLQNDASLTQENPRKTSTSSYQKKSSRQTTVSEKDEEDDETEFLKNENKSLRKTVEELTKYAEESEYYKKLAESKFRECSALAEEIICLRTDLDRSNSNYLRIQRQHGSGSKGGSIVSDQPKINNTKGFVDYGQEQERYGFATRLRESRRDEDEVSQDEREDEPPSPQKFTIRPAKDERSVL